jgi:hypothetical protein
MEAEKKGQGWTFNGSGLQLTGFIQPECNEHRVEIFAV